MAVLFVIIVRMGGGGKCLCMGDELIQTMEEIFKEQPVNRKRVIVNAFSARDQFL